MTYRLSKIISLLFFLLVFNGCKAASTTEASAITPAEVMPTAQPESPPPVDKYPKPLYPGDFLTDDKSLKFGDFQLERRTKPIIDEGETYDGDDGHEFAVLKKKGRVIAKFDSNLLTNPLGTDIRFAIFPLLGKNRNQLIVEQTEARGWAYWVADLDQNGKVIFNSPDYGIGEDIRILDIDGDGQNEIVLYLITFWYFEGLNNPSSPLIDIVFKYDSKAGKYIPANPLFRDYVFRDIKEKIKESDGKDNSAYGLSDVLKIVLTKIYVGEEKEAWEFYDREYNEPDKNEMKFKIKKRLAKDSVYKAISK